MPAHEPNPNRPTRAETGTRLPLVDAARFWAAVAVIWIHTSESPQGEKWIQLCRIAVPFFVASLVGLNLTHLLGGVRHQSWIGFAKKRFLRLYLPFLLWSGIYLGLRLLKHQFQPTNAQIAFEPSLFLNGTAHHLWFLPMAFLLSLLLFPTSQALCLAGPRSRDLGSVLFLGGAIAMALVPCPMTMDATGHPLSYFVGMSWTALPAALFTIALTPWLPAHPSVTLILLAWSLVFATASLLLFTEGHPLLPGIGGAALWVGAHARVSERLAIWFSKAGSISFGIYLIHVAFVEGIQTILHRIVPSPSPVKDLSIACLALTGSVACTLFAQKIRPLRVLFPR